MKSKKRARALRAQNIRAKHFARRYRHKFKKASRRRVNSIALPSRPPLANTVYKNGHKWSELKPPPILSVTENAQETIAFFSDVLGLAAENKKVRLNLADVEKITPDAILYILSVIDFLRRERRSFSIGGNVPARPECAQLLADSGFFNFVKADKATKPSNMQIFSITSGVKVDVSTAKGVVEFVKKQMGFPPDHYLKNIYRTLIECMANTNNHAYKHLKKFHKWHLIAHAVPGSRITRFTFTDNGLGIPSTMKKNWHERILRATRENSGEWLINPDGKLIFSALIGEFRTSTGKAGRGRGLPSVYRNWKDGNIKNLTVVSNYGAMLCETDERVKLRNKFVGTLITWDFIREENGYTN